MNKYMFYIEGRNFWIQRGGGHQKCDMFTTKHIEAETLVDALARLNRKLKTDPELKEKVVNVKEDPPIIRITQIDKVDHFKDFGNQEVGIIFIPETADELDTMDTV